MSQAWMLLHDLGAALWIGGAWAAIAALSVAPRATGDALAGLVRAVQALTRLVVGPGMILTTAAGLLLAFDLYRIEARELGGVAGSETWLFAMIGAGLAAALLTIVSVLPDTARLSRYDAAAEDGRAVRWAIGRLMPKLWIGAALATLALVGGVLGR